MKIAIAIFAVYLFLVITAGVEIEQKNDTVSDITLIPHSDCNPKFKDLVTYKTPQSGDCVGVIVVRQA